MALTVGTAGHVDHGKTTLVRALTGKDTDRLPEEQARGISIDLGYAPLELPSGRKLSLVDVPGHERFVRTMVAGATGIDLFLLVIDAAEGARPQTHEHLAILRLLGVERASSRSRRPTPSTRRRSSSRSRRRASSSPEHRSSPSAARRARGSTSCEQRSTRSPRPSSSAAPTCPTRLYVDRVFTLRGIGTVATGTLWSGTIADGDGLRLRAGGARGARPLRAGARRARGAGRGRAACRPRLPGVERSDLPAATRSSPQGAFPRSYRLDVALEELEPIADGARLSVHHGTRRIPARVVRVGADHAQLRLASPSSRRAATASCCAARRRSAAQSCSTLRHLAGVERGARRAARARRPRLDRAGAGRTHPSGRRARRAGPARRRRARGRARRGERRRTAGPSRRRGSRRRAADVEERLRERAEELPLEPGLALAELLPASPGRRRSCAAAGRAARREAFLPGRQRRSGRGGRGGGRGRARAAGCSREGRRRGAGAVSRTRGAARAARRRVRRRRGRLRGRARPRRAECTAAGEISLARFRDLAGVGRRDAQLLLERVDADGLTRRSASAERSASAGADKPWRDSRLSGR